VSNHKHTAATGLPAALITPSQDPEALGGALTTPSQHPLLPPKKVTSGGSANTGGLKVATTNSLYVNFRGYYGTATPRGFAALVGDQPPKITGGYAKWHTEMRPLRRAVTIFDGYDAAQMTVSIRFGVWTANGWDTSDAAGQSVEDDIGTLEWMAGAHFAAGQSPYVYVNTYQGDGTSSPLVPFQYQQTANIGGNLSDPSLWPWVVHNGISWGSAWRNDSGYRVYQDASVGLMAFEGFSGAGTHVTNSKGSYYTSKPKRDDPLLIAAAPDVHAMYVDILAGRIMDDPKNNPILGTKMKLKGKSKRVHIPHGHAVWVPQHQV